MLVVLKLICGSKGNGFLVIFKGNEKFFLW